MYLKKAVIAIGVALCVSACSNSGNSGNSGNNDSEQQPAAPVTYERTAAQQDFIDKAAVEGSPRTFNSMLRLGEGLPPIPESFDKDLALLNSRGDTADFGLPAFLTILAKYADSELIDQDQLQLIEDAVINFKFWPDQLDEVPGTTDQMNMVSWTENHYILFASGGYIAGQLYPDRVFPASGLTGAEMMEVFEPRILRWLELRYKSGFSEWLSNNYYDEEVPGLMALIELVDDQSIALKASMVLDLLLADMALNSFQGNFGATHGRSYTSKMNGRDSTRGIMHLLFGLHSEYLVNPSAIMLAVSERYRAPEVLNKIANDVSETPMVNRQRMGINIEEAADWGVDVNNINDGMLLMTMEPYTHPLFIETFYAMLNAYDWWELRDFQPFNDYRAVLSDPGVRASLAETYAWDISRNMRPEVNTYTYRTPDYMLSTAQDWRKGFGGDQSSIWQATLGIDVAVFTTHPGSENLDSSPNYWVGSGTLPRSAQVRNVAISLYDVDTREGIYVSNQPLYSHAFLPRARFDESAKEGNWFFARHENAYLALWSSDPDADWIPAVDNLGGGGDYDIIAEGEKTIWLCELGDASEYGDFASFKAAINAAALTADANALTIRYESPSQGVIEMAWDGDVLNNGVAVELDGYDRYDNPWSEAAFPASDISFSHGDSYLKLNFDAGTRDWN